MSINKYIKKVYYWTYILEINLQMFFLKANFNMETLYSLP